MNEARSVSVLIVLIDPIGSVKSNGLIDSISYLKLIDVHRMYYIRWISWFVIWFVEIVGTIEFIELADSIELVELVGLIDSVVVNLGLIGVDWRRLKELNSLS